MKKKSFKIDRGGPHKNRTYQDCIENGKNGDSFFVHTENRKKMGLNSRLHYIPMIVFMSFCNGMLKILAVRIFCQQIRTLIMMQTENQVFICFKMKVCQVEKVVEVLIFFQ